eukprot:Tamp_04789.p1 GENE.Tamp_04789~~Tamp_04789.p1  ORF type:complete len:890 (-),score=120.78 Tamp_04789:501-2966(-)
MTTDHAHPQQLERVSSLRLEEQPYAAGHLGRDVRRRFPGYDAAGHLGRDVRRRFPGWGVVSGKVVSYNPDWGLYGIKYEDGDEEQLDELKLQSVLVPHHENKDWTGAELALAAARRPFDEMGFAHEDDSQCSWALAQGGGAKAGGKCDKGPPSDLAAICVCQDKEESVLENVCCPAVQRSSLQCGSARSTYMIDSEREDSMPTSGSFRRVSSSPRCSASLQGNTAREAGQSADAIDQVRANSANENEVAQRDSREEEAAARSREAEAAMQEQEEEGRWSAEAAAAAVEGKEDAGRAAATVTRAQGSQEPDAPQPQPPEASSKPLELKEPLKLNKPLKFGYGLVAQQRQLSEDEARKEACRSKQEKPRQQDAGRQKEQSIPGRTENALVPVRSVKLPIAGASAVPPLTTAAAGNGPKPATAWPSARAKTEPSQCHSDVEIGCPMDPIQIPPHAMSYMIGSRGVNRKRVERFSQATLRYDSEQSQLRISGTGTACRKASLCVDILLRKCKRLPVLSSQEEEKASFAALGIVCKTVAVETNRDLRAETVSTVEEQYNVIIFIDWANTRKQEHPAVVPLRILGESKAGSEIIARVARGQLFPSRHQHSVKRDLRVENSGADVICLDGSAVLEVDEERGKLQRSSRPGFGHGKREAERDDYLCNHPVLNSHVRDCSGQREFELIDTPLGPRWKIPKLPVGQPKNIARAGSGTKGDILPRGLCQAHDLPRESHGYSQPRERGRPERADALSRLPRSANCQERPGVAQMLRPEHRHGLAWNHESYAGDRSRMADAVPNEREEERERERRENENLFESGFLLAKQRSEA